MRSIYWRAVHRLPVSWRRRLCDLCAQNPNGIFEPVQFIGPQQNTSTSSTGKTVVYHLTFGPRTWTH